jgi:DNA-binding XRE family transcriptional regulator
MTPEELKKTRAFLGLTPTQMAKACGIPYRTYNSYENGSREIPQRLENALIAYKMLKKAKLFGKFFSKCLDK